MSAPIPSSGHSLPSLQPEARLVNAEVARQGLAAVVVIDGNNRFYPPIAAARDEAAAAGRGLYSPDIACTIPGQVNAVTAPRQEALTAPDVAASFAELDAAARADFECCKARYPP